MIIFTHRFYCIKEAVFGEVKTYYNSYQFAHNSILEQRTSLSLAKISAIAIINVIWCDIVIFDSSTQAAKTSK